MVCVYVLIKILNHATFKEEEDARYDNFHAIHSAAVAEKKSNRKGKVCAVRSCDYYLGGDAINNPKANGAEDQLGFSMR